MGVNQSKSRRHWMVKRAGSGTFAVMIMVCSFHSPDHLQTNLVLVNFYGNPHIVQPGRADYQVPHADVKPTFPKPLPAYLPRVSPAPSGGVILRSEPGNINSAYSGRFTLSLRGVRKDLRQRGGGMARRLVQDIEAAIQTWLDAPDASSIEGASGRAIDHSDSPLIKELSCKPLELVWITDDPFARWIVHCVSRWHGVVSFSEYYFK